MNFIHRFWPALLEKHSFLQQFVTPIVKVAPKKSSSLSKKEKISFFSMHDYHRWYNDENVDSSKFKIKYYKVIIINFCLPPFFFLIPSRPSSLRVWVQARQKKEKNILKI